MGIPLAEGYSYCSLDSMVVGLDGLERAVGPSLQIAGDNSVLSRRSVHSQSFDVPVVARYWAISVANVMWTLALSSEDIKRKRPKYSGSPEQRWREGTSRQLWVPTLRAAQCPQARPTARDRLPRG